MRLTPVTAPVAFLAYLVAIIFARAWFALCCVRVKNLAVKDQCSPQGYSVRRAQASPMPEAAPRRGPTLVTTSLRALAARGHIPISVVLSTHSAKHSEAQTNDERDRVAAHVGEGDHGTENHVGEAAGSDARMQTEPAREKRKDEDGWQDADRHEEEAKACVSVCATVYAVCIYVRGACVVRARRSY